MKPYSNEIKNVKAWLEELEKIRELIGDLQENTVSIENDLSALDNALPTDKEIAVMPENNEKKQLLKLLDLLREAFAQVDEILGAPEDEMTGEPVGTPMDPVARGSRPSELRLEDFLRNYKPGGKGKVS